MKYYEAGFIRDGITSVNLIHAPSEKSARRCAEKHAERYGYKLSFFVEVDFMYADSCMDKGMPVHEVEEENSNS